MDTTLRKWVVRVVTLQEPLASARTEPVVSNMTIIVFVRMFDELLALFGEFHLRPPGQKHDNSREQWDSGAAPAGCDGSGFGAYQLFETTLRLPGGVTGALVPRRAGWRPLVSSKGGCSLSSGDRNSESCCWSTAKKVR